LTDFLAIPTRTSTPIPDDTLLTGQSPRTRTYSDSTIDADEALNKTDDDVEANSSYHSMKINLDEDYKEPASASEVPDAEMLDASLTKP
jgi:hypothetical protein